MEISDYSAAAIIIVTFIKTVYDYHFAGKLYDYDISKKLKVIEAVSKKKRRDRASAVIVFGVVAASTIIALGNNVMKDEVSKEEFDKIVFRIEKIEKLLDPPGPSGGGLDEISKKLDSLSKSIEAIPKKYIDRKEFEEVVREIAELKKAVEKTKNNYQVARGGAT